MSRNELSEEQMAALDPGVALLEACPGSGKTRTIVQRFKRLASTVSKGIALLSFTNAAVDEATSRCRDQPQILKSPNFVGTFDSFIHRYIVTPVIAPTLESAPTYLESWSALSMPTTMLAWKQPGAGIELSSFQHDNLGRIFLDVDTLNRTQRNYFNGLASDGDREALMRRGIEMIQRFNTAGIFDCDSARAKALAILRSDKGPKILSLLSHRFHEVMVDEFQDCSGLEHEIIKLLSSAGIHTLVVADPDQSIYEFRGATAAIYDQYKSSIPVESRRMLVDNYRSSTAICQLLSSVRTGRQTVVPSGAFVGENPGSVFLMVGAPADIGARFSALAKEWNIPVRERIVLAHRTSDAQKLGSGIVRTPSGSAVTTRILRDIGILQQQGSPTTRRKAIAGLETTILSLLAWPDELTNRDNKAKLEHSGVDSNWLRLVIGRLIRDSEEWIDIASCKSSLVSILGQELASLEVGFGKSSLKQKMSRIFPDAWTFWIESKNYGIDKSKLQWSTIHGAKGNEYDAVLLNIPDSAAENAWMLDSALEDKRVFYVGASRARRILAIATPKSRLKTFMANFDSFKVPYEVIKC